MMCLKVAQSAGGRASDSHDSASKTRGWQRSTPLAAEGGNKGPGSAVSQASMVARPSAGVMPSGTCTGAADLQASTDTFSSFDFFVFGFLFFVLVFFFQPRPSEEALR